MRYICLALDAIVAFLGDMALDEEDLLMFQEANVLQPTQTLTRSPTHTGRPTGQ